MITKFDIGKQGRHYMHAVLRESGGLSSNVAGRILEYGYFFAPLPDTTSAQKVFNFETGGICDASLAESWLFDDLQEKNRGTFIVQDVWAKPADLLAKHPLYENYCFFDGVVYYFIDLPTLNHGSLSNLQKQVSSFQFIGFYIENYLKLGTATDREITRERMHSIEISIREIYVSAYDRESFIVWRTDKELG